MKIVEAVVKQNMLYLLVDSGGGRLLAFKTAIREFEITFSSPYSYHKPGRPTGRIDLAVFDFQAKEGGYWHDEENKQTENKQIETVYKLPKP